MIVNRVIAGMHLNVVQEKVFRVLQKMSHLSAVNLGLWPKIRKMLCSIVAEQIILYAVLSFYFDKVVLMNLFLSMQQTLPLYVTKCYSTISTDVLHVLPEVSPLDLCAEMDRDTVQG